MVGRHQGGALRSEHQFVEVGPQPVHLPDPRQLVEVQVGDDGLALPRARRHRAFPPREHRFAVELLVLQIERGLVSGEEPAQLPVGLQDHEASLARARWQVHLGGE